LASSGADGVKRDARDAAGQLGSTLDHSLHNRFGTLRETRPTIGCSDNHVVSSFTLGRLKELNDYFRIRIQRLEITSDDLAEEKEMYF